VVLLTCRLSSLVKLRELKLYDNRISAIGNSLSALSMLHTLDLSSNRLQSIEVTARSCMGWGRAHGRFVM
jgi:Leucine-rich repeat (LRR) protein